MSDMWFQCRLRRDDAETVLWIEERGAHVGKSVELLPEKEFWDVIEVFHPGLPHSVLVETQKANRGSLSSIKEKK